MTKNSNNQSRRAVLNNVVDDFLRNTSWQLDEGSQWIHDHHDTLLKKNHIDVSVDDVVGVMQAACESDLYDQNRYLLTTSIPLLDSNEIQIEYPKCIEQAILENRKQNEPPAIHISHRSGLLTSLLGQTQFRVKFSDEQIPEKLHRCGVIAWYNTWPFDLHDPSESWSRSVLLMHCPELNPK